MCHISQFVHCSLLLVLPTIKAKPPWRSAQFLASFIKIAWDHYVLSWSSADLSCSAPTSPHKPEKVISYQVDYLSPNVKLCKLLKKDH